MMRIVKARDLERAALDKLLARPAMETNAELRRTVADIIAKVRTKGDKAVIEFGQRFDGCAPVGLLASRGDIESAAASLDPNLLAAIDTAIDTVGRFHAAGKPSDLRIETATGVTC